MQADADAARVRLRAGTRGFASTLFTSGFGDTSQPGVRGVTLGV